MFRQRPVCHSDPANRSIALRHERLLDDSIEIQNPELIDISTRL